MLRNKLLAVAALIAGLLLPAQAMAAYEAYTRADLNLRVGPDTTYGVIDVIPYGEPVVVLGCLEGYYWCDVEWFGLRGWVAAQYLVQPGTSVYLPQLAPRIALPVIGFSFYTYHDRHYRDRPWYKKRHGRWRGRDWHRDRRGRDRPRTERPRDRRDADRPRQGERIQRRGPDPQFQRQRQRSEQRRDRPRAEQRQQRPRAQQRQQRPRSRAAPAAAPGRAAPAAAPGRTAPAAAPGRAATAAPADVTAPTGRANSEAGQLARRRPGPVPRRQ
jgi:uncharacterized protein YraI